MQAILDTEIEAMKLLRGGSLVVFEVDLGVFCWQWLSQKWGESGSFGVKPKRKMFN